MGATARFAGAGAAAGASLDTGTLEPMQEPTLTGLDSLPAELAPIPDAFPFRRDADT
jgi:hypothetical protein